LSVSGRLQKEKIGMNTVAGSERKIFSMSKIKKRRHISSGKGSRSLKRRERLQPEEDQRERTDVFLGKRLNKHIMWCGAKKNLRNPTGSRKKRRLESSGCYLGGGSRAGFC